MPEAPANLNQTLPPLGDLQAQMDRLEEMMSLVMKAVRRGEQQYTVREAAQLLGRGESTIWAYIKDGRLGSTKEGGARVILGRHIEEFQRDTRSA